jgi:ribosome modulation factor
MDTPPNDLDAHALGRAAPLKGLPREACPYAEGTEARARWLAGYDEAVQAGVEPVTGGIAGNPGPAPAGPVR